MPPTAARNPETKRRDCKTTRNAICESYIQLAANLGISVSGTYSPKQHLAKQEETLQQRLNVNQEERSLARDEKALLSSKDGESLASIYDKITLVDTEIDRAEGRYREPILPHDLRLFANSREGIVEESEDSAVEDGSHPGPEAPDAKGNEKTEEGAEDLITVEEFEDEGP